MKLPFTEQFLWDVFNACQKVSEFYDFFAPKTMKQTICFDAYKMRRNFERRISREKFSRFIHYLKKQGYLECPELQNKSAMLITPKGLEKIKKIALRLGKANRRPDGKWQMVIYDIPEEMRDQRDAFRNSLINLGYIKWQKSVWISPYDVLGQTQSLIRELELWDFVRLLLIEEVNLV